MISLAALAAGLAFAACPSAGDWPQDEDDFSSDGCPQVYQVHGSADVAHALNIVVVSDAFDEQHLEDYRCGTGLTVEALVATPPLNAYSDSINVYRIDLASTVNGVEFPERCGKKKCSHVQPKWTDKEAKCQRYAQRSGLPAPLYGKPVGDASRQECLTLDIDAQACPQTAQECQLLWPGSEGLMDLWRLAACAPAFDIVVLIGNTGTWAGGGTADTHPPLAVTTLNGIDIWYTRSNLLRHELGHALGLLDEYTQSEAYSGGHAGAELPAFHGGRNVAQAEEGELPRDVPWKERCTKGVAGLETYAAGECFTVCANCADCDLPSLPPGSAIGLYEGSFYNDCGYFRASQTCTMQQPSDPFCPACTMFIDDLFRDMGIQPNAGGPISTQDPDPPRPSGS